MSAPRGASQSEMRLKCSGWRVCRSCSSLKARRHFVGPKGKRRSTVEWCEKKGWNGVLKWSKGAKWTGCYIRVTFAFFPQSSIYSSVHGPSPPYRTGSWLNDSDWTEIKKKQTWDLFPLFLLDSEPGAALRSTSAHFWSKCFLTCIGQPLRVVGCDWRVR